MHSFINRIDDQIARGAQSRAAIIDNDRAISHTEWQGYEINHSLHNTT